MILYQLFRKISTIRLSAFPKKKTRKQVTGLLTGFYEKERKMKKRLYRFLQDYHTKRLLKKIAGIY